MRLRFSRWLGLALVSLVALAACQGQGDGQQSAGAVAVPVRVASVREGAISATLSFSGSIQAADQVELLPGTSGRIERILVDVGSVVRQGEPIAQLETDTLRAALKSAAATLQSAQAQLNNALAGARPEQVAAARAGLEAARVKLTDMRDGGRAEQIATAEANVARAQARLYELRAISQAQVDKAAADLASAEARLNQVLNPTLADLQAAEAAAGAAQASLQSAQAGLDRLLHPGPGDVAVAEANLESARARLAAVRERPTIGIIEEAQRAVEGAREALLEAQRRLAGFDNQLRDVSGGAAYLAAWSALNTVRTRLEQDLAGNVPPTQLQADQLAVEAAWQGIENAERDVVWSKLGFTAGEYTAAQSGVKTATQNLKDARKTLVDLDPAPKDEELRAAEVAVRSAEASLDRLVNPSAADVAAAQAAVDQARSALAAAQNRLTTLKDPTPADVEAARAAVASARVAFQAAQAKWGQPKDGVSPSELQAAESDLIRAQNDLALARNPFTAADLQAQEQQVAQLANQATLAENPYTSHDLQRLTAGVAVAEAAVEQARLVLDQATVTAPFDAIVAKKYLSRGALAGPATPIVSLVSSRVEVVFHVEEAALGRIGTDQAVTFTVPAYEERAFMGQVSSIAPIADAASRTFTVKITPEDAAGRLKAGMFANLQVIVAGRERALVIPRPAALERPDGPVVFVVRDGTAEMRRVRLGLTGDSDVEVLEGLAAGEAVVVQGNRTLRDNDPVKVIEP
ncbi:MAG: efflux RND transporter periplasmic adaptor subunit [Chloroflexi bacterium]|nr:efflux RND transporter periplasmic adaptor subunit [Chloroflexota bacterium]